MNFTLAALHSCVSHATLQALYPVRVAIQSKGHMSPAGDLRLSDDGPNIYTSVGLKFKLRLSFPMLNATQPTMIFFSPISEVFHRYTARKLKTRRKGQVMSAEQRPS